MEVLRLILIVTIIHLTDGFTKEHPVVNRLNYGLAFTPGPKINLMSGRWLHIYRLKVPKFPGIPEFLKQNNMCPDEEVYAMYVRRKYRPLSAECYHATTLAHRVRLHHGFVRNTVKSRENQDSQYTACPWDRDNRSLEKFRPAPGSTTSYSPSELRPLSQSCQRKVNVHGAFLKMIEEYRIRHQKRLDQLATAVKIAKRDKRAFIDISKPLKSLFGIARHSDIEKMSETIKQVVSRQDDVLNVASKAYKHTVALAETVHQQFNTTLRLLGNTHQEITQLARKVDLNAYTTQQAYIEWTQTIHQFQAMYQVLDEQYQHILNGIDNLLTGKLTPNLIPVSDVIHTIQNLHRKLAENHPQYTSPIHSPQDFYQNTEFYLSTDHGEIIVAVFIPISHVNGEYQIYHVDPHPYPVAYQSQHMANLRNTKDMIAVSIDRQYFFFPSQRELTLSCIRHENYLCLYNPTLMHSSNPNCVHAIFANKASVAKQVCQYDISMQPLQPNIYRFDQNQYIMTNVSEYQLDCKDTHETKKGCFYCLVHLACECTISAATVEIQSSFDQCAHPNTTTTVKYPINVMVANFLKPNNTFAKLLGHQLQEQEDTSVLSSMQVYEHAYQEDIATAQNQQLDLGKVMTNLKNDKISFKDTADRILHDHPVFTPAGDSMFSVGSDIIHIILFLWCAIITIILGYFACKFKMLSTPLLSTAIPTVRAQTTTYNSQLIMTAIENNHHILTTTLVCIALILIMVKVYKFCTNGHRWDKVLWLCCLCAHTRFNPRQWNVYVTFPSIEGNYFWKLRSVAQHLLPHPSIQPGSLATLSIHTVIPYVKYRAKLTYAEKPMLRGPNTSIELPTEFGVNACLARKLMGHTNRLLCPVIMLEVDQLLFTPPPFLPQESPSSYSAGSSHTPQKSLLTREEEISNFYKYYFASTFTQYSPAQQQNAPLRESVQVQATQLILSL